MSFERQQGHGQSLPIVIAKLGEHEITPFNAIESHS